VLRAGERPELAARLGEVFACETGVFTDTQVGDRFRLVIEKNFLGSDFYRYGRLLAAEYQPAAKANAARPARPLRAFLGPLGSSLRAAGAAPGAAGQYFNEGGDSLAHAVCVAPLLYGRAPGGLSDPAAARPIAHADRGHLGLEYPIPPGTPVVAAGAGKIASLQQGNGPHGVKVHTVVITHPGGIETTYQNLGRLARGLSEGQQVRLRQVIGYVGQPPASSGHNSHLLFALRVGGKPVEPGKWKGPREAAVPAGQRAAFSEQVSELMEQLAQADIASPQTGSRLAESTLTRPAR
jgi:murein DD-endopeptidase MepM/ murein hydrolase activator NlpD